MWNMIWPMMIVVLSNVVYHISQKSTPSEVNAFASLMVTYTIGALTAGALFLLSAKPQNVLTELGKINWTAFVLGVAIVGLEAGWIFIYRAGWKVSVASLTANLTLACVLLFVGVLLYKEVITLRQFVGMVVCAAGLTLINHP